MRITAVALVHVILAGEMVGCHPKIVVGKKGSVIQPFSGWRGNAAIIVDYGDCSRDRKGYM